MHGSWWWIDRWLKSSAYHILTLEEQGAYRNLLDQLWLRDGVLPNDDRILGRMCGDPLAWPRIKAAVLPYFRVTADGLRHDTHDEVATKSRALHAIRSAAGKRGNASRWTDRKPIAKDIANTVANASSPSPSPSPISVSEKKQTEARAKKARPLRRAPRDLTLTPERRAFADGFGLNASRIEHEWAKFHDYEFATGRTDWDATWRNWVRKASEGRNGAHRGQTQADYDAEYEAALVREREMRKP